MYLFHLTQSELQLLKLHQSLSTESFTNVRNAGKNVFYTCGQHVHAEKQARAASHILTRNVLIQKAYSNSSAYIAWSFLPKVQKDGRGREQG